MTDPRKIILTGLGTGYLRPAPGTWGSAAAVCVFIVAAWLSAGNLLAVNATLVAVALLSGIGCVALGRYCETAFGRKDPSYCTIDEWAGQSVSLLALPIGGDWNHWLISAAVAFVAFRVFDIIKPPPARQLERLPYGWGVLLDDVFAGIYANIASQLVLRLALGFHS